jgi:hypothetical protein
MTTEQFEAKYPLILGWIEQTLAAHTTQARPVASLGFKRLPQYFSADVLQSARVVYVEEVPMPALSAIGLGQFADFENMDAAGITYLDTFFSHTSMRENERHHLHELVHVLQWRALGPKRFIAAYADGLERYGYRDSPLEAMAFELDKRFKTDPTPFDVSAYVQPKLAALYSSEK